MVLKNKIEKFERYLKQLQKRGQEYSGDKDLKTYSLKIHYTFVDDTLTYISPTWLNIKVPNLEDNLNFKVFKSIIKGMAEKSELEHTMEVVHHSNSLYPCVFLHVSSCIS